MDWQNARCKLWNTASRQKRKVNFWAAFGCLSVAVPKPTSCNHKRIPCISFIETPTICRDHNPLSQLDRVSSKGQRTKGAKDRQFSNGDAVLACNYSGHEKWVPATATQKTHPVSYSVKTNDIQIWWYHLNQLFRGVPKGDPGGSQEMTNVCTSEDFPPHTPRTPVLAPSGIVRDSYMATSLEQPPSTETVPVLRWNP